MDVDILGQADGKDPMPQAIRQIGIMIAGDQMPGDRRKSAHDFERFRQRFRIRARFVINIARDQHRPCVFRHGELADRSDRIPASPFAAAP